MYGFIIKFTLLTTKILHITQLLSQNTFEKLSNKLQIFVICERRMLFCLRFLLHLAQGESWMVPELIVSTDNKIWTESIFQPLTSLYDSIPNQVYKSHILSYWFWLCNLVSYFPVMWYNTVLFIFLHYY